MAAAIWGSAQCAPALRLSCPRCSPKAASCARRTAACCRGSWTSPHHAQIVPRHRAKWGFERQKRHVHMPVEVALQEFDKCAVGREVQAGEQGGDVHIAARGVVAAGDAPEEADVGDTDAARARPTGRAGWPPRTLAPGLVGQRDGSGCRWRGAPRRTAYAKRRDGAPTRPWVGGVSGSLATGAARCSRGTPGDRLLAIIRQDHRRAMPGRGTSSAVGCESAAAPSTLRVGAACRRVYPCERGGTDIVLKVASVGHGLSPKRAPSPAPQL